MPESPAGVVDVGPGIRGPNGVRREVTLPGVPGLYRLTTTFHAADGTPFDASTQSMLPSMLVRITGDLSVAYGVQPVVDATPGAVLRLPVRIANTGSVPWGDQPNADDGEGDPRDRVPVPWLIGRWVPLTGFEPADGGPGSVGFVVESGDTAVVEIELRAPTKVGPYLLVLDVVTPAQGSLAAAGSPPAIVRVMVTDAAPSPSLTPSPSG
jgi:hypothetical protein